MDERSSLVSRMSALLVQGAGAYCVPAAIACSIGVALSLALIVHVSLQIGAEPSDPLTMWRSMSTGGKQTMIVGLLLTIWLPVALAARGVCRITFDLLANRKPSPATALIDMARFLPAAIAYSFLFGVPVFIGMSFFSFPGALLVASFFTLVIPAGINERGNFLHALKRGFSLSGRIWKIYGKILLTTVASVAFVGMALALRVLLLDDLISGLLMRVLAIRMTLVYIPGSLVLVMANICFTLLYLDAREQEAGASPQNPAAASSGG